MVQLSLRFLNLFMVLVAIGAFDLSDQQRSSSSSSSSTKSSSSAVFAAPITNGHSFQPVHRSDKARVGIVLKSGSSAEGLNKSGSDKRMEKRRKAFLRRGGQAAFKAAEPASERQKASAFKGFEVAHHAKQRQTLSLRKLRHSGKQGNPLMVRLVLCLGTREGEKVY